MHAECMQNATNWSIFFSEGFFYTFLFFFTFVLSLIHLTKYIFNTTGAYWLTRLFKIVLNIYFVKCINDNTIVFKVTQSGAYCSNILLSVSKIYLANCIAIVLLIIHFTT